jgi:hypothetical protein
LRDFWRDQRWQFLLSERLSAIAQRIRTAEEVEVEKFYDYSGEGSLGLNLKDEGVMLGAGGKESRFVKRICRFKGVREITPQEIQVLAENMADDEAV